MNLNLFHALLALTLSACPTIVNGIAEKTNGTATGKVTGKATGKGMEGGMAKGQADDIETTIILELAMIQNGENTTTACVPVALLDRDDLTDIFRAMMLNHGMKVVTVAVVITSHTGTDNREVLVATAEVREGVDNRFTGKTSA